MRTFIRYVFAPNAVLVNPDRVEVDEDMGQQLDGKSVDRWREQHRGLDRVVEMQRISSVKRIVGGHGRIASDVRARARSRANGGRLSVGRREKATKDGLCED